MPANGKHPMNATNVMRSDPWVPLIPNDCVDHPCKNLVIIKKNINYKILKAI